MPTTYCSRFLTLARTRFVIYFHFEYLFADRMAECGNPDRRPGPPGSDNWGRTGDVTDPGDESVFKNTNAGTMAGTHCLGDNAQRRARNAHAHI